MLFLYKQNSLYNDNLFVLNKLEQPLADSKPPEFNTVYATVICFVQFYWVLYRSFLSVWRNTAFTFTRIILNIVLAIIFGLVYLQIDDSDFAGVQSKLAAIFTTAAFCGTVVSGTALPVLVRDRAVYYREQSSYTYTSLTYSIAIFIVEVPWIALMSIIIRRHLLFYGWFS